MSNRPIDRECIASALSSELTPKRQRPKQADVQTTVSASVTLYLIFLCAGATTLWWWLADILLAGSTRTFVSYAAAALLFPCVFHFFGRGVDIALSLRGRRRTLETLQPGDKSFDNARCLVVTVDLFDIKSQVDATFCQLLMNERRCGCDNLGFCILSDWKDATEAMSPDDLEVLRYAVDRFSEMNMQRVRCGRTPLAFVHRRRIWSPSEKCWMGRERKRGKIEDFNRYLIHGESSPFVAIVGDVEALRRTEYVIVLDSDTELLPDAADCLLRTIAHPSQSVRHDRDGRLIGGHCVIQPLMLAVAGNARTLFERHGQWEMGVEPPSSPFNLFQDHFGAGSFYGKGIYAVRAFAEAVEDKIPPGAVLSHDVIEGCFANSAASSNVCFAERVPLTFLAQCRRRERWWRGDLQNLSFVFRSLRAWLTKAPEKTLSLLAHWKIIDNARRCLNHLADFLVIVISATSSGVPIGLYLVTILMWSPRIAGMLIALISRRLCRVDIRETLFAAIFEIMTIPLNAWQCLRVVGVTSVRMFVTRTKLLDWVTYRDSNTLEDRSLQYVYIHMWPCPVAAVSIFLNALSSGGVHTIHALLLAVWGLAPFVAWYVSRPFDASDDVFTIS